MCSKAPPSRRPARRVPAVLAGRRGVAALEFALLVPVILAIVLGTYDIGNAELQLMTMDDAVRAGGQYAMSFPTNTAGITNAVTAVLPGSTPIIGLCTCNDGAGAAACSATCPADQAAAVFVKVTVQHSNRLLLLTAASLANLSATYVARVK